jgi:hypothetical protein
VTRARQALARAERGYREAIATRDPVMLKHAVSELQIARRRAARQETRA